MGMFNPCDFPGSRTPEGQAKCLQIKNAIKAGVDPIVARKMITTGKGASLPSKVIPEMNLKLDTIIASTVVPTPTVIDIQKVKEPTTTGSLTGGGTGTTTNGTTATRSVNNKTFLIIGGGVLLLGLMAILIIKK